MFFERNVCIRNCEVRKHSGIGNSVDIGYAPSLMGKQRNKLVIITSKEATVQL